MRSRILPFLCSFLPALSVFSQNENVSRAQPGVQEAYNTLFASIEMDVSDSLREKAYDQILRSQNTSIDREIMLRQKLQYADRATLQLFKTKDSLLTCLGREYEKPPALRKNVAELEKKANDVGELILTRVQQGQEYFLALSVKFARAVYEHNPTPKNLGCYTKISVQKGNQKLADQLLLYAAKKERSAPRWQQVRDELTGSEAAIEFVSYRSGPAGVMRYGALVLRRGYPAPHYVALCTQPELDAVLKNEGLDEVFYQQNLYRPQPDDDAPTLHGLIWKPLEPLLKSIRKVYYAPAGDLHRLNIAAISASAATTPLQDQYDFILINSTRSLISNSGKTALKQTALPAIKMPCAGKTIVPGELASRFFGNIETDYYDPDVFQNDKEAALFGNIYYDMDSFAIRNPNSKDLAMQTEPPKQTRKRQISKTSDWDFLYGTKTEIDLIRPMLAKFQYKVRVYEGYEASEEAFKLLDKNKNSPRIVHIATHGFFLADTSEQNAENQMNRSGLILAGANHAWKKGAPLTGLEDGILSAFEISVMNLQNTELVALSACETGLGYIVNNEGVFGLQRAFKQAGVKNLMVSLWSIPDNATQLLMTQFYQNCLEKDMPMRQALKAAQQWMRAQEAYQNPYYWAGFVLLE
jgi:CHAT domain